MLFEMTFDESILIRVVCDFTTSPQAVLAIGTYIVTYSACACFTASFLLFIPNR